MRHPRPARRGRVAKRLCRLVNGPLGAIRRWSPLGPEQAGTYDVALARARDLRTFFPDFYQLHFADRLLTPRALFAAVQCFLSLVNNELFEIEDYILDVPVDPLRALKYTEDGSREPLLELEEVAGWLAQPQAVLYGIGVESMLEEETPQQWLTLALWHLCRTTNWSTGVDVADVIGFSYMPADLAEWIVKLPVLPARTDMDQVVAAIKLPPWSDQDAFDELIAYPFARTDNPMANATNAEVEIVYGGQVSDTWDDARGIAENAAAAQALVKRYGAWANAVEADPRRELRALTKALHVAVEASALRKPQRAKTLLEVLADIPQEEEVPA